MNCRERGEPPRRKKRDNHWSRKKWSYCTVVQGMWTTVLLHYNPWYGCELVTFAPRDWGLTKPVHFELAGFTIPRFPMRKPVQLVTSRPTLEASVDDLLEQYALLAEYLASNCYDGDEPGTRLTSTLTLFAAESVWKAVLRDRQQQKALWVSCPTFFELFSVMEGALAAPGAIWRNDRASGAAEANRQKPKKSG